MLPIFILLQLSFVMILSHPNSYVNGTSFGECGKLKWTHTKMCRQANKHTHTHMHAQLQRCGNMRNFNESNAESQSAIIEGCVQISSFWEPTISSVTLNREDNYTLQEGFACRSMYLTWGDKYSHTLKTSRTISKDWYSWNEKRKYLAWTNKRYRPHQFDPFF